MGRNAYTDAVKDAIGNDPVLDQYEFDYTSTYVGSSQDDHLTGTIITRTSAGLSTDLRGKNFSVYSSPNENSIGYSSGDIARFPRMSSRLQSNREVSSTQQLRHASPLFDDKERWYDSCLPDLFAALQHDGTNIKTLTTSMKVDISKLHSGSLIDITDFSTVLAAVGANPTVELKDYSGKNMESLLSLSPMATFTTKSLGFVTFNVPRLNEADDPSINNEWTWSYPYETKYNPSNRQLKTNDVLGLSISTAQVLPALAGDYSSNIFPPSSNKEPYCSAPLNLPWQSYNGKTGRVYQLNSGIIPVIAGNFQSQVMSRISGSRNGNRTYNVYDSDSYFLPIGTVHDNKFGHATVAIGDAFLNQTTRHTRMVPTSVDTLVSTPPYWSAGGDLTVADITRPPPSPFSNSLLGALSNTEDYITSSASKDDLIKFFFGFGDVNNMNYGRFTINEYSGSIVHNVTDRVQNISTIPGLAYQLGSFSNYNNDTGQFVARWESPNNWVTGEGGYQWRVLPKTSDSAPWHVWTSSPAQIRWISGSSPSNDAFLTSGAGMSHLDESKMFVDIYSESPWRYTYLRCVASLFTASYLESAAFRINVHGHTDLPTSSMGSYSRTYDFNYNYSGGTHINELAFTGSHYGCYGNIDHVDATGDIILDVTEETHRWKSQIFPPGVWRIGFIFRKFDDLSTGSPNQAFIFDLKFEGFGNRAYENDADGPKIGANNYPEFRQYGNDIRNCPKDEDYPSYYYKWLGATHRNRNFRSSAVGVGPVIRGWKHGLASGFPTYSKATWRCNRFGQLRDMLEQRPYTKFIYDHVSMPLAGVATPGAAPSTVDDRSPQMGQLEPGPVQVNYVRRRYKRDDRGIGFIYSEKVDGSLTLSQNISTEVTSSVPYVDGVARLRQEAELSSIKPYVLTSVSTGDGGITIV